jgi:prephenate dehydrogenase
MLSIKNVAIIGGRGLMGAWFSRFFIDQGCSVIISDAKKSGGVSNSGRYAVKVARSNADAVNGADLIIISVMMANFKDVILQIAPYIKSNQVVMDITSVKSAPVGIMHKYIKKGIILGTHPMFGPGAGPEGQNFILTPSKPNEMKFAKEFSLYLRKNGFNVIIMDPRSHDNMIAAILSLTHFVGFVTAATWKELKIQKHANSSSTSFRFLKSFVKSILDSSPELYSYLQTSVPNVCKMEESFIRNSIKWKELARKKRSKELAMLMSDLKSYIDSL